MSLNEHDEYQSPLVTRYAGTDMRRLFSARHRIRCWRRLWIWLAEAEQGRVQVARDAEEKQDLQSALTTALSERDALRELLKEARAGLDEPWVSAFPEVVARIDATLSEEE